MNNQYPRCRFPEPESVRISITTDLRSLLLTSVSTVEFFRWICCCLLFNTFFSLFPLPLSERWPSFWPQSTTVTIINCLSENSEVSSSGLCLQEISRRNEGRREARERKELSSFVVCLFLPFLFLPFVFLPFRLWFTPIPVANYILINYLISE